MQYVPSRLNPTGLHQVKLPTLFLLPALFVLSTVLASCEDNRATGDPDIQALKSAAQEFVPEQASELTQEDGLPWVQMNFKVAGDPAAALFNDGRMASAKREGWRICRPSSEGASAFEDRTVTPARQRTQTAAVLFRGGIVVVIAAVHDTLEEPRAIDGMAAQQPAVFQQLMVIARHADAKEFEETAKSLNAQCE